MKHLVIQVVLFLAFGSFAAAADIQLLSTGLFRGVLPELVPLFERETGHKVLVNISTPGVMRDRLLKGEAFDVALIPTNLNIDEVLKADLLAMNTRRDVATTFIGIAARVGSPKLNLNSAAAVRDALASATSIALTDPAGGAPIGVHVQQMAEKYGFAAELKSRVKPIVGSGEDVARAVANGEAEIGITLASEIASVQGVDVVGALPSDMQLSAIAFGVQLNRSKEPVAGKAFIEFLLSPEAKAAMKRKGVEPL